MKLSKSEPKSGPISFKLGIRDAVDVHISLVSFVENRCTERRVIARLIPLKSYKLGCYPRRNSETEGDIDTELIPSLSANECLQFETQHETYRPLEIFPLVVGEGSKFFEKCSDLVQTRYARSPGRANSTGDFC